MTSANILIKYMNLHWNKCLAEMLGTAILLFFGTASIILNFGSSSFLKQLITDQPARHFLTGLMFAGTGSLVAISPISRLSGGHINPGSIFFILGSKKDAKQRLHRLRYFSSHWICYGFCICNIVLVQ